MSGFLVNYLGNMVPRDGFRAYVYSVSGDKKLVNSWSEFQSHMQTGIWFAQKQDLREVVEEEIELPVVKPKKAARGKKDKRDDFLSDARE